MGHGPTDIYTEKHPMVLVRVSCEPLAGGVTLLLVGRASGALGRALA